jgi:hypothetical protein
VVAFRTYEGNWCIISIQFGSCKIMLDSLEGFSLNCWII